MIIKEVFSRSSGFRVMGVPLTTSVVGTVPVNVSAVKYSDTYFTESCASKILGARARTSVVSITVPDSGLLFTKSFNESIVGDGLKLVISGVILR